MKLTNEKIEEIMNGPLIGEEGKSICTELLEHRRLANLGEDLEKIIEDGWQSYKGHHVIGEMNRHPALQSAPDPKEAWKACAHFVIPIIRAEREAEIKKEKENFIDMVNNYDRVNADVDARYKSQIASQAAEIEELLEEQARAFPRIHEAEMKHLESLSKIESLHEQVKICEEALNLIYNRRMSVYISLDAMVTDKLDIAYQALSKIQALKRKRVRNDI
jgi:hypothetical protein